MATFPTYFSQYPNQYPLWSEEGAEEGLQKDWENRVRRQNCSRSWWWQPLHDYVWWSNCTELGGSESEFYFMQISMLFDMPSKIFY